MVLLPEPILPAPTPVSTSRPKIWGLTLEFTTVAGGLLVVGGVVLVQTARDAGQPASPGSRLPWRRRKRRQRGAARSTTARRLQQQDLTLTSTFAPMRFLSQKAAVDAALKHLGVRQPKKVTAELESSPAVGSPNCYAPSWRINVDGSAVVVTNAGEIRGAPAPSKPEPN